MRTLLTCALILIAGCSDKTDSGTATDSGETLAPCAGNSILVEVCIDCGDAGGCDQMGDECRSICDTDEDCSGTDICISSDDGNYCDEPYACD